MRGFRVVFSTKVFQDTLANAQRRVFVQVCVLQLRMSPAIAVFFQRILPTPFPCSEGCNRPSTQSISFDHGVCSYKKNKTTLSDETIKMVFLIKVHFSSVLVGGNKDAALHWLIFRSSCRYGCPAALTSSRLSAFSQQPRDRLILSRQYLIFQRFSS